MTEYELDIQFLLHRSIKSGGFSVGSGERDTGISSNSIVAIAYGLKPLSDQLLPYDRDDLSACLRMWDKLPDHRKTDDAWKALENARKAINP